MASKTRAPRKRYSHAQYVAWGRKGGSPILLAWKLKHPVKKYRVSKTKG